MTFPNFSGFQTPGSNSFNTPLNGANNKPTIFNQHAKYFFFPNENQNKKNKEEKFYKYQTNKNENFVEFIKNDDLEFSTHYFDVDPNVINDILNSTQNEIFEMKNQNEQKLENEEKTGIFSIFNKHVNYQPISTRNDYEMNPSIEILQQMSFEELKKVSSFTIARRVEGRIIGSVEWKDVDLTYVNFDDCVFIEEGEITVYNEYCYKPSVGDKLNRRCKVTLYGVIPDEEEREERDQFLDLFYKNFNVKNIDFEHNAVCFIVQHFSTYSLKMTALKEKEQQRKKNLSQQNEERKIRIDKKKYTNQTKLAISNTSHNSKCEKTDEQYSFDLPTITVQPNKNVPFEIDPIIPEFDYSVFH